jgi:hypothetical protein
MRAKVLVSASLLGLMAGTASAARIYVTAESPGIGTGACSLQEAIYSSVLHDTLDGAHGIAIDATDQGNPPDHFITTGCVLGDGNDTIVLPTKGTLTMKRFLDGDAYNPYGPTATPLIFSTITIEGNGATLAWDPDIKDPQNARLFAIGAGFIKTPNGTASGTGSVTLRNVHVTGFRVKGGDGTDGGGGGLGAGGAIYVHNGASIVVESSTFDGNQAVGGNGAGIEKFEGGGGGGLAGNGGEGGGGGGGGGAARDGGASTPAGGGGGGGGTVFPGGVADVGGPGGYLCGGNGGSPGNDGADATKCAGGGGGGSGGSTGGPLDNQKGGKGSYGGGGGGGFLNGGDGGFGGGGGSGNRNSGGDGGTGGFGGGGGTADDPGDGGPFGGNASGSGGGGGGGGALGGAVFGDHATITVRNSTFTNNAVARGVGGPGAHNGGDGGGAIFSHDGDVTIVNSTFSRNQSTGSGGAVVVYMDPPDSSLFGGPDIFIRFTLDNTIIANNGENECFFTGNVHTQGVGNLIMSNGSGSQPFGSCPPDVIVTANPQLGALGNNGGYTPTMAIPFGSAAMGAADSATSLATDQRGATRPQAGGFDIGAYEVCRIKVGAIFQPAPCSETTQQDPPIVLTVLASTGGTTDPAAGSYPEIANTVTPLHATPFSGYYFTAWTGNVTTSTSASTTIVMNAPQTVGADFQLHDFALSLVPTSVTIPLGGIASTAIATTALGDFRDNVSLSASGQPTGIGAAFGTNPVSPVPGTPASSILTLTAGASAHAQTFTETVEGSSTGLSGALVHSVPLQVTIVATAPAVVNVIGQEQALGCIDQSGIVQSLTAKLNAYQALASGGHAQGASNVLTAFQYEVQAQIGHHIVTSCMDPVTNTTFSPGATLIADAQSLQATLATVKGAPVVGSVVSTSDAGTGGRTVSLLSGKSVIATAATDAVGFYYFDSAALQPGESYSVTATIPKGYKTSSPASQSFSWSGSALQLAPFTLN